MLLFIAVVLLVVFGVLGLASHLLWLGLLLAVGFAVAHVLTGGLHGQE